MKALTQAEYRMQVALQMSEDELQREVRQIAVTYGWRIYHTHDSRRSDGGFPDLVLVRGKRLIFAELKKEKGRFRPKQEEWLEALSATTNETYVWRPSDLLDGTIIAILRRK